MRSLLASFLFVVLLGAPAYGTVPTFQYTAENAAFTLLGGDPMRGGTTTIPVLVVPVALSFEARAIDGKRHSLDATADVQPLLRSPIFSPFPFTVGGTAQYADAMLRATFPQSRDWHVLLAGPTVRKTVEVKIPSGAGYILLSKKTGRSVGIADIQYVQRELFKHVEPLPGTLIIAVTHNVSFYAEGDATICCSFGTHGTDSATRNSFVLASYLGNTPALVEEADVQPITEQLGEFIHDPLHDPLLPERSSPKPGNVFPAWVRLGRRAGTGVSSPYFLLEPTDVNPKNNFPFSRAFEALSRGFTYHLQNIALLPWYLPAATGLGDIRSFPDPQGLTQPAQGCPSRDQRSEAGRSAPPRPTVAVLPRPGKDVSHQLIGYWSGYGAAGSIFPLREISPQWDVIIVAFSTPDKNAPEGTMQFHTPAGLDTEQFKADIAYLKSQKKTVLISLGGGGQHFTLADPKRVPNFVASVTRIVSDYGFDGIDIDFESPSLSIQPGDGDFRHPRRPRLLI
jgi:chitinase